MTHPCIVITYHTPSFYEWALTFDQEEADGDTGETSIKDCLLSALGSLPTEGGPVEIRYRGIHMGTYSPHEVEKLSDEIAAAIADRYRLLFSAELST